MFVDGVKLQLFYHINGISLWIAISMSLVKLLFIIGIDFVPWSAYLSAFSHLCNCSFLTIFYDLFINRVYSVGALPAFSLFDYRCCCYPWIIPFLIIYVLCTFFSFLSNRFLHRFNLINSMVFMLISNFICSGNFPCSSPTPLCLKIFVSAPVMCYTKLVISDFPALRL